MRSSQCFFFEQYKTLKNHNIQYQLCKNILLKYHIYDYINYIQFDYP